MMKTIIKVALIATIITLFSSCEKMSFEDYLAANEVTIDDPTPTPDPTPKPEKPTEDGEIVETGLVDLGLSVKWAACNLDTDNENNFTSSCELMGKTYGWATNSISLPPDNIGGTDIDNATAALGAGWKTPSRSDVIELINNCYIHYSVHKGTTGLIITGTTKKAIFIPFKYSSDRYWTSTCFYSKDESAYYGYVFNMDDNRDLTTRWGWTINSSKSNIRPVFVDSESN